MGTTLAAQLDYQEAPHSTTHSPAPKVAWQVTTLNYSITITYNLPNKPLFSIHSHFDYFESMRL